MVFYNLTFHKQIYIPDKENKINLSPRQNLLVPLTKVFSSFTSFEIYKQPTFRTHKLQQHKFANQIFQNYSCDLVIVIMVQLHDNFFLPSGISFTYIHVSEVSKAKTLSRRNTAAQEQNHTSAGAFIVLSSFRTCIMARFSTI